MSESVTTPEHVIELTGENVVRLSIAVVAFIAAAYIVVASGVSGILAVPIAFFIAAFASSSVFEISRPSAREYGSILLKTVKSLGWQIGIGLPLAAALIAALISNRAGEVGLTFLSSAVLVIALILALRSGAPSESAEATRTRQNIAVTLTKQLGLPEGILDDALARTDGWLTVIAPVPEALIDLIKVMPEVLEILFAERDLALAISGTEMVITDLQHNRSPVDVSKRSTAPTTVSNQLKEGELFA